MPSLPLQSLASTRLFLMSRWTGSLLSCKKRWLRNPAETSAGFHSMGSKWEIVIKLVQVESLILRLASKFPGRRDQLLFLINNYDVVRLKHHIIYKREVWFLDALASLKTMFKIKSLIHWCFQDYKISRVLQSITEYNRVLQSIAEYYRVLQSITEYCRVLQSITEYCRELQSITEYYRV